MLFSANDVHNTQYFANVIASHQCLRLKSIPALFKWFPGICNFMNIHNRCPSNRKIVWHYAQPRSLKCVHNFQRGMWRFPYLVARICAPHDSWTPSGPFLGRGKHRGGHTVHLGVKTPSLWHWHERTPDGVPPPVLKILLEVTFFGEQAREFGEPRREFLTEMLQEIQSWQFEEVEDMSWNWVTTTWLADTTKELAWCWVRVLYCIMCCQQQWEARTHAQLHTSTYSTHSILHVADGTMLVTSAISDSHLICSSVPSPEWTNAVISSHVFVENILPGLAGSEEGEKDTMTSQFVDGLNCLGLVEVSDFFWLLANRAHQQVLVVC